MMAALLNLPTVMADAVAARRRMGHGLRMPFQVAEQSGELLLEPGPARRVSSRCASRQPAGCWRSVSPGRCSA